MNCALIFLDYVNCSAYIHDACISESLFDNYTRRNNILSSSHYLCIHKFIVFLETRVKRISWEIPRAFARHTESRRVLIYSSSLSHLFLSPVYFKSSYDGISIVIIPSRDFDETTRNVSFALRVYKSFSFDGISCRFLSSSCSLIRILRLPAGRCNFSLPQPLCHLSWRAMNRAGLCIREVIP